MTVSKITNPPSQKGVIDKINEVIDNLGGGGGGSVDIDNLTITENSSNELQAVAVIDNRSGNAIKTWTGTKAQYDAIVSKDANTLYNITDDSTNDVIYILSNKADINLNNVNNTGTSMCARWSAPSDTYDDVTLGASGASYTAPADGWYVLNKVCNNGQFMNIGVVNNNAIKYYDEFYSSGTISAFVMIHVAKGDNVLSWYNASGTTNFFRFYYTKGNEWEAS